MESDQSDMLIPAILYGRYRDIRPLCARVVARLTHGEAWEQVVASERHIETRDNAGLLALHGPSTLLGAQPNFHCFLLHSLLRASFLDKKLSVEAEREVFERSLEQPWSLLGLLSEPSTGFFYPQSRHHAFFQAVHDSWTDLAAEGQRYTDGRDSGMPIWAAQTTLSYVLVHLGVPRERVIEFQSDGNLTPLLKYIHVPESD